MHLHLSPIALAAAAAFFALPALAEEAPATGQCRTVATNGMVAAVLCPKGQTLEQWKAAGIAACGDRKPCGAWIWDDADAVPAALPAKHEELGADAVRRAKSIWINETGKMVILEKGN